MEGINYILSLKNKEAEERSFGTNEVEEDCSAEDRVPSREAEVLIEFAKVRRVGLLFRV